MTLTDSILTKMVTMRPEDTTIIKLVHMLLLGQIKMTTLKNNKTNLTSIMMNYVDSMIQTGKMMKMRMMKMMKISKTNIILLKML